MTRCVYTPLGCVYVKTRATPPITSILGVYRGRTLADARLVAVSADPELVADVAARMLQAPGEQLDDPVLNGQREAERAALRVIKREAEAELEEPGGMRSRSRPAQGAASTDIDGGKRTTLPINFPDPFTAEPLDNLESAPEPNITPADEEQGPTPGDEDAPTAVPVGYVVDAAEPGEPTASAVNRAQPVVDDLWGAKKCVRLWVCPWRALRWGRGVWTGVASAARCSSRSRGCSERRRSGESGLSGLHPGSSVAASTAMEGPGPHKSGPRCSRSAFRPPRGCTRAAVCPAWSPPALERHDRRAVDRRSAAEGRGCGEAEPGCSARRTPSGCT